MMTAEKVEEEVTLAQAAHLVKLDYQRLRNGLLQGKVEGRQVAGRFWLVDLASARRFASQIRDR